MSNDFETSPEPDEFEFERPDPEEPETWQHEVQRDAEIDDLDWVDQHSAVQDPVAEEEAPQLE